MISKTIYRCAWCNYKTASYSLMEDHEEHCAHDPAKSMCITCEYAFRKCKNSNVYAFYDPSRVCEFWKLDPKREVLGDNDGWDFSPPACG